MAKKKQEEKKRMSTRDMKSFANRKLDTVKMLLNSSKQNEAIVYMFHILAWLIEDKHDVRKSMAVTLKEYFTNLVMDGILPPENVHPFVNLLEEILYSNHEMSFDVFNNYRQHWDNLYKEITGDKPPSF